MRQDKNVKFLYAILTVLLLATFIMTAGCGSVRAHCRLGGQTCDTLLGKEVDEQRLLDIENTLKQHQKEIDSLKTQADGLIFNVTNTATQISILNGLLDNLEAVLSDNANVTSSLVQSVTSMNDQIEQLQAYVIYNDTRIADMLVDLVELQQQDTVAEYIYPCGDRPNSFDEVLLRTKSGKLIAYFETGGNRFLSILNAGSYSTTDSNPKCHFSVDSNGNLYGQHR